MIINKSLRDFLISKGFTIDEMSELLAYSRTHMSRIFNSEGKYTFSINELVKISDYTRISLDTLLNVLTNSVKSDDPFFINQLNLSSNNNNATYNSGKNDQEIIELQKKVIELQERYANLLEKYSLLQEKYHNSLSAKTQNG